jgi:hypothetical protein
VVVLAYSTMVTQIVDGNTTARVSISVATLAVITTVWVARRIWKPSEPSRTANWLMIVLIAGALGALPLPWASGTP